jgi:hypothetical protein
VPITQYIGLTKNFETSSWESHCAPSEHNINLFTNLLQEINKCPPDDYHSGIATSTGRHALLSNALCRKPVQAGLDDAAPDFKPIKLPLLIEPPALSFVSPNGGEDTNRSLRVRCPCSSATKSFSSFFCGEQVGGISGCAMRDDRRLSSIRRVVLRRRNWTTGLVLGLRVGLGATPHWVASSLNFWSVAMYVRVLCFLFLGLKFEGGLNDGLVGSEWGLRGRKGKCLLGMGYRLFLWFTETWLVFVSFSFSFLYYFWQFQSMDWAVDGWTVHFPTKILFVWVVKKRQFYSLVPTKHSKVIIDLHSNQSNYAIIFF